MVPRIVGAEMPLVWHKPALAMARGYWLREESSEMKNASFSSIRQILAI